MVYDYNNQPRHTMVTKYSAYNGFGQQVWEETVQANTRPAKQYLGECGVTLLQGH